MDKINIKQIVFYIPIIILIFIGINYFFFDKVVEKEIIIQYKKELPQKEIIKEVYIPTEKIKEKIVTKTIIKYIEKPTIKKDENISTSKITYQNILVDDIQDYDIKIKDEVITLTTRYDRFKKYKISLNSNKKITSTLPSGSYILLNGTIEENNKKSKFDLSFNEYYSQFSQDLYLQVTNNENNTTTKCDGSFLNGVASEYSYSIQLDIMGDLLSCYIVSKKEMPNIQELFNGNELKSLDTNSSNLNNNSKLIEIKPNEM